MKPLSNVDTAWLQMEDPTNLMMVTGVLLLQGQVDFERLKQTIAVRLLALDRFRMKVTRGRAPLGRPRWVEVPHLDIDAHVQRIALPAPGDKAVLQEVIGDLMSTGLDFGQPLWHFHLIEGYGEGSVLFGRLHHCIGDGTALVAVMLNLMDLHPDTPLKHPPKKRRQGGGLPLPGLFKPARSAWNLSQKAAGTLWQEGRETLSNPAHALALSSAVASAAGSLGKVLLMLPDPPTPFKGKLGIKKRPAWSEVIPLEDVKKVGRVVGAKVNDVLLTAMTGGLRRYLLQRGSDVTGLNFRAVVPVNLRPLERALELGNAFSLVFLSLPVGIEDPLERLFELKRRMDAIKDSPEAMVNFGILNIVGRSPRQISDQIVNLFGTKATAVMTNVPGPRMPLYLAGSKVDNIMFWVPQSGRLGLGVSILSYDGKVTLGVATDAGLVPDPEAIIDGFHQEFQALMELVRQVEASEAQAEPTPPPAESQPGRCQATTRAGSRCKRRAQAGSAYCFAHQP